MQGFLVACLRGGDRARKRLKLCYYSPKHRIKYSGVLLFAFSCLPTCRAFLLLAPNTQQGGWTPLHEAARSGRVEIVRLLLGTGTPAAPATMVRYIGKLEARGHSGPLGTAALWTQVVWRCLSHASAIGLLHAFFLAACMNEERGHAAALRSL
jgi:hypothetical protein